VPDMHGMTRIRRALLAMAFCAVAFAAGTVVAQARTHTVDETAWMVCPDGKPVASGHLDTLTAAGSVTVQPPPIDGVPRPTHTYGIVDVTGTITACHPVPSIGGPGFGIGSYATNNAGVAGGGYLRYSALGAGGTFSTRTYIEPGRGALCLITNPTTRLECYRLSWSGNNPVVGDRLRTDDPLVSQPAPLSGGTREPGCPPCIQ